MEQLELTDPIVTPGTLTVSYRVLSLLLNWEGQPSIPGGILGTVDILLKDNLDGRLSHRYEGQPAIDMMKWLNTANFSVNSMHKRILQKLSNDGVIPGTVTGTPDPAPSLS